MELLPLLHICAATVGLLSGYLSMLVRKGAGLHRAAGHVFVVSMLMMSASAAYLAAFVRPNELNVVAALFTFYLVATGWWAGRRGGGGRRAFDVVALVFVIAVVVLGLRFGGGPVVFACVAALFAAADVRMLLRGGVTGARRISRHLWRMGFALLIATLSLYPGQAKLFPQSQRDTGVLFAPHVFLAASLIIWMVRVRRHRNAPRAEASEHHVSPLPAAARTLVE